ncbi:hypothetical protein GPECTOR_50g639 [Gonium pectorale]|uniref:EGF-like domain-containing protein n=1 Tax=Gonium pectorale TaxID=33097 RepID=A0A150G8F9_GONPE|nr:hypothetical protein GPECTOR_50g639 [Gonium pectorale]|eukprot:KXZ45845.1 hypothetical protein GPECTOR_50g639 [Gonium pectorale]
MRLLAILVLLFVGTLVNVRTEGDTELRSALTGQAFNKFQESNKDCAAGCSQYGNCNRELGECECPFGFNGTTCEEPWLPACRTTTVPGVPIFVGRLAPRNCLCYEQLRDATCPAALDGRCSAHIMGIWGALYCFDYTGKPADQQLSELPERMDDPGVRWRRGVMHRERLESPEKGSYEVNRRELEVMQAPPKPEDISYSVPLSKCPARCHDRGICRERPGALPQCFCHSGFTGDNCGQATNSALCPNDCGFRGTCVNGFCKCKPPYWGVACSRSKAYEPAKDSLYHPYYPSLKIYVYDLPLSIAGPQEFDDGETDIYVIYRAFIHFMEALLRDTSGIRTENPYEANLFYIPTFAYYATSNLGDPTGVVVRAVDWVRSKFPFFDRYQGKDHFVVLTADRGACYLRPVPQTKNLIRLVHFGLEAPNITRMAPLMENNEYGCFKSGRDVVLAPYFKAKGPVLTEIQEFLLKPGGAEAMLAKKKVLFFFSGDVRHHEPEYSGGVRQVLSGILANASYPDVVFKGGYLPVSGAEYEDLMTKSKFCLAPYGHGWGIRLTHAIMHACVPVIIQDRVRQPYEDLLHYPDFSIRVPKADLPRLVEILRAVPNEDILRMMRECARYRV